MTLAAAILDIYEVTIWYDKQMIDFNMERVDGWEYSHCLCYYAQF
jgi:hypothetical protein